MRDRLLDLLSYFGDGYKIENRRVYETKITDIADYLLANGVIVLPCKVGDLVHFKGLEIPWKVAAIHFYSEGEPQISITSESGKITSTMTAKEFDMFACVLTDEEDVKGGTG